MSIRTAHDRNFEQEIRPQGVTLVDFGAVWCPPCRALEPIIDELDEHYRDQIAIVKVDCDESPETTSRYGIMSMPTVMVFKDGEPTDKLVGLRPASMYRSVIDRAQRD